ncbi:hypothetical protein WPS_03660 [Vulcanimicrobium alpinum]|uniref:Uncharacterized protein n=1 Tax=Vulcanimicrobium alpinum TaxID=3016050 RepID=A0AAN1XSN9_UNVUL|nr:hypothetical protein [Vulcanimicrobium alpinum]BDE05090.1 hypothetical protein WPS_03660 [Vulcanimicrobium alpinum]
MTTAAAPAPAAVSGARAHVRTVRPEPARPCVGRTRPDFASFRGWGVSI